MKPRLDYAKVGPQFMRAILALHEAILQSGIEPQLLELVRMRVSQINGCAFCVDMHSKDARAAGETEQRLYALTAWHETPFFTERERAALAWAEAITRISEGPISDELFEKTRVMFPEQQVVALTWAIVEINSWNRVAITFGNVPGSYRPQPRHGSESGNAR